MLAAAVLLAGCSASTDDGADDAAGPDGTGPDVTTTTSPSASPTPRPPCEPGPKLVPTCGRMFGVAPMQAPGETWRDAIERFEAQVDDRMSIIHAFHRGVDEPWPTDEEAALAAEGRILFVNWRSHELTWAEIAAGAADHHLDAVARRAADRLDAPFFFSFNAEMEDEVDPAEGSGQRAEDFAAAFRHVVERLRAGGADGLVPVVVYTGTPSWAANAWYDALYPGDDVVDWVGQDPYVFGADLPWRSDLAGTLDRRSDAAPAHPGFMAYAAARFPDKPVMLAEWGVVDDPADPASKPRFFAELPAGLAAYPQLKALVYFDSLEQMGGIGITRVDSSEASTAALREVLDAPLFERFGVVGGAA